MANEQTLPIRWNLTGEDAIVQGMDWRREELISYETGPWNTAGYTAFATFRTDYDSAVVLSCTTENGRIEVGIQGVSPNQRNIAITLTSAATKTLTAYGLMVWDLWLKDSTGHETMVHNGQAVLVRRVSP